MKIIHHLIISCLPLFSFGQLTLGGNNPQDLVLQTLSGSGVTISDIIYVGSSEAISYFSANTQNMPFHSGFLMTTGYRNLAVGPNNDPRAGIDNGYPGSTIMNSYIGGESHNAAILSFDLIPSGDSLKIKYIFGSDEYPEYVGAQYCDAFAIFVQGPGINGTINIATVPNQSIVSINTVNGGNPGGTGSGINASPPVNLSYFINNGDGSQSPYNSSAGYVQYDGLTKPLIAKTKVTPNQSYHVMMIIIDAVDGIYDSGVFIEEGGITASVSENNLSNFVNVFYSASNQQATIQITDYQENLTYSIVDLSGKIMTQSKISETTSIDLSNYSSGMYLIQVEGANGKMTKKVIR
ncbi:choice-of-anchor L domain-containing protein [Fluviicola taffensis]|uniref:choice-of-anchor L domain-containing protein n=1 Tax=Fluviicola taffensis TaxID=191579 RepID=UPI003137CDB8